MKRRELLLWAGLAVSIVACENADRPDEPVWGKQPCAHCAMIVDDRRYAAQLVANDERKYFDDIGCMVLWIDEKHVTPRRAWVHDSTSEQWLEASQARYAKGARTPMNFGFEVAERGVSYDEVRASVLAKKSEIR